MVYCSVQRGKCQGHREEMDDPILKTQDKDSFLGGEVKVKDTSNSSCSETQPNSIFSSVECRGE